MASNILLDCGGPWIKGSEGGSLGRPPDDIMKYLSDGGINGVVISGLVAWIEVQISTENCDTWKALAEKQWLDEEVTQAKEAL